MEFRGHLWLEHTQIWIQSGLFGLYLLALSLSVAALWRPRSPRFHRIARGLWLAAMLGFLSLWVAGATLEMMRRVAPISWRGLVVALAAFSLLMAGVLSLARECFDEKRRLLPGRIVLTLLALTFAGCYFKGFALAWNRLFETVAAASAHPLPKGWVLALCGAQLLTVAHNLQPIKGVGIAVRSPREATLWLLGFFGLLVWWNFDRHLLVALVAYAGFVPLLVRTWSARLGWKRRGETTVWVAAAVVLGLLVFAVRESFVVWKPLFASSWRQWPHVVAWGILAVLLVVLWRTRVNFSLRLALEGSVAKAALLTGTLTGALAASLLFGPSGALWWSFWPLAGLFFDLLQVDDEYEREWQRLDALKHELKSQHGRSLEPDSDSASEPDSLGKHRTDDEPVELSAAGRPVEER